MKILPYGDTALLVKFENQISLRINERVIHLYKELLGQPQVKFLIPAYSSLTIGLADPKSSGASLYKLIEEINDNFQEGGHKSKSILTIPVCYESNYGLDMNEVVRQTGLSAEQIIQMHCSTTYHVYMLGFLAGFAYLGKLPTQLEVSRKDMPRRDVAKGSVGLAGSQTGVYPTQAPGGWQIIGQTPIELFDKGKESPSIISIGQKVRFRPIETNEFKIIQIKVDSGIYEYEIDG